MPSELGHDTDGESDVATRADVGETGLREDTGLSTAAAHLHRAEMDRVTAWRGRLDQTTNWASSSWRRS